MSVVRNRLIVASAVLPLALLAGCDSQAPGQALPTSEANQSSSSPEATGKSDSKAPPIPKPLAASKYIQDPCSSLTEAQKQEFNVTSSKKNSDGSGVGCIWNIGDGSTSPAVSYLTTGKGLDNLYALNDSGHWSEGYFEPTEVGGYPAVYAEITDNRDRGDCVLAVGIKQDLFFHSSVRTHTDADPCKAAENVAEAILETIKAGA